MGAGYGRRRFDFPLFTPRTLRSVCREPSTGTGNPGKERATQVKAIPAFRSSHTLRRLGKKAGKLGVTRVDSRK